MNHEASKEIARFLWSSGAIKLNLEDPFVLRNGSRSPIFIDCVESLSDPIFVKLFVLLCSEAIKKNASYENRSTIVASNENAIPWASCVALSNTFHIAYIKNGKVANNIIFEGNDVVLIDNVITDGNHKSEMIDLLLSKGSNIAKIIVICDRMCGGPESIKRQYGIDTISLTDIVTVLQIGAEEGYILPSESLLIKAK